MIVVSDTTPINYLVLIDAIGILPKLFDEVCLLPLPTLAVIERAARRGLLELQRTTYRVRPELIQAVLDREAARKKSEGH